MRIILETNYAVRIVDFLAVSNRKADVRGISEGTCAPPRFALKILCKLVSDGIVQSYKEAHGGYTLTRPDSRIILREVTESVEGPYMISRCQRDEYTRTHQAC